MINIFFVSFLASKLNEIQKVVFNLKEYNLTLLVDDNNIVLTVPNTDDKSQYAKRVFKLQPIRKHFIIRFKNDALYADDDKIEISKFAPGLKGFYFTIENTNNGKLIKNHEDKCISMGDLLNHGTFSVELNDCLENKFSLFEIKDASQAYKLFLDDSTVYE